MKNKTESIRIQLSLLLGAERANTFIIASLSGLGLPAVTNADDLYKFGEAMSARSSAIAAVGRSAMGYALLRGARRPETKPAVGEGTGGAFAEAVHDVRDLTAELRYMRRKW